MSNDKNISYNKEQVWIDQYLMPAVNILGYAEEVESLTKNLSRMDFFKNKNWVAGQIQHNLIEMSAVLEKFLEHNPGILEDHHIYVPYEKMVKIGKAIQNGFWALVYQQAWWMATKGVALIKLVLEDLLGLP